MSDHYIAVDKLRLWFVLTIASITTLVALIVSSGGWGFMFIFLYYVPTYTVVSLIILILALRKRSAYTVISKRVLWLLLLSFLLMILFSPSDCGDASGKYVFLFYIVDNLTNHGAHICADTATSVFLHRLLWPIFGLHLLMLVLVISKQAKIISNQSSKNVRFVFVSLIWFIFLSLTIAILPRLLVAAQRANIISLYENQAMQAELYAPYSFTIIPPEKGCSSVPYHTIGQVLEIFNTAELEKAKGGFWVIRFEQPVYIAENDKFTKFDTCVWTLKEYLPSAKFTDSFETSKLKYLVDDRTGELSTVHTLSGLTTGFSYPMHNPSSQH